MYFKKYFKYLFSLFFLFVHTTRACGILVSQPGIKPMPPAVVARIFNHWTTREVLNNVFLILNAECILLPLSSLYICNKGILMYPEFGQGQ